MTINKFPGTFHFHCISDARIIDWDHVHPVPLPLTAITQEDGLLHSSKGQKLYLLESQNSTFLTYLANLESSHPSSLNTSYLYNNSRQHDFLNRLLRRSHQETFIKYYSDLVSAAYSETTTEDIQKEWDYFCNRYFVKQALRIPDWPQYIDVQEQLGLHKRKLLHTLRWNKLPTGWRGWSRISLPEGTWDWIWRYQYIQHSLIHSMQTSFYFAPTREELDWEVESNFSLFFINASLHAKILFPRSLIVFISAIARVMAFLYSLKCSYICRSCNFESNMISCHLAIVLFFSLAAEFTVSATAANSASQAPYKMLVWRGKGCTYLGIYVFWRVHEETFFWDFGCGEGGHGVGNEDEKYKECCTQGEQHYLRSVPQIVSNLVTGKKLRPFRRKKSEDNIYVSSLICAVSPTIHVR